MKKAWCGVAPRWQEQEAAACWHLSEPGSREKTGHGLGCHSQGPPDSNPFLLTMSQLLKVPLRPETAPPIGIRSFNIGICEGIGNVSSWLSTCLHLELAKTQAAGYVWEGPFLN